MIPPGARPRSLPLQIAKWLAITLVILGCIWIVMGLVIGLTGWGRLLAPTPNLIVVIIMLSPWIFGALFVWHWAAAILNELRGIRGSLRKINVTLEREQQQGAHRER
jgi:hypothetical protein